MQYNKMIAYIWLRHLYCCDIWLRHLYGCASAIASKLALRSASAIFGSAIYTVAPRQLRVNLHCARLLRIFATVII